MIAATTAVRAWIRRLGGLLGTERRDRELVAEIESHVEMHIADKVFRMVMAQGLRLALAGLAIGVVAALILSRLVGSFAHLLYGVGRDDPATFVAVSFALVGVAVLACWVPARRAVRVDPMVALRYE